MRVTKLRNGKRWTSKEIANARPQLSFQTFPEPKAVSITVEGNQHDLEDVSYSYRVKLTMEEFDRIAEYVAEIRNST